MIELLPRLPNGERPSDYTTLAAEQVDLDNVINELLLRLEWGHSVVEAPGSTAGHPSPREGDRAPDSGRLGYSACPRYG